MWRSERCALLATQNTNAAINTTINTAINTSINTNIKHTHIHIRTQGCWKRYNKGSDPWQNPEYREYRRR